MKNSISLLKANCFFPGCIVLIFILAGLAANAQNHAACGTDYYWQDQLVRNPGLAQQRLNYDMMLANSQKQNKTNETTSSTTLRVIPVVFHIIHNYGPENIDKSYVISQLAKINADYQKRNSDTANVRAVYKSIIADCRLEFRLATIDPNGNCTDGIDRVVSTITYNAYENVKSLVQWDPSKYLNIWVVSFINLTSAPGTYVAGYAQFPTTNNPSKDGIVVRYNQINSTNTTLTHEIGHYLNLYHTFESYAGSECGRDCTRYGDFVCDTPPAAQANYGCNNSINSCTSDNFNGLGDRPDMIENYMDYSNCSHMFSLGQSSRIDAALIATRRATLITASNLLATGTDSASQAAKSCAIPVSDFYAGNHEVCQGGQVQLKDNSYNASVTSWLWTIPNAKPATGFSVASQNPTFVFPDTGYYNVTLKVSNANGTNTATKSSYIHVIPAASPVVLINEDFEKGIPGAWDKSKDNNGNGWVLTTKAAASGSNSIYLNTPATQTDSIYSFTIPEMDLAVNHHQILTFKMAYAQKSSASSDLFRIFVSDICATTPPKFYSVFYQAGGAIMTAHSFQTGDFVPAADEWRTVTVDLSSYRDVQKLGIKFWFQNRGGNNIYIDDINIGDLTAVAPVGISNHILSVYPNPVSEKFSLEFPSGVSGLSKLEVFDISGKLLGSKILEAHPGERLELSKQSFDISVDGMYYLKLIVGNNTFVQKLIILKN